MGTSIFIATPAYGPLCTDYSLSLVTTIPALERAGHAVQWKSLEGCCYVHTARNKLVRDFLFSGADELLWIDADIGWQADDMVRLCGRDRDIVGASAPYRAGPPGFAAHVLSTETDADGLLPADVVPTAVMKVKRAVFMKLAAAGKAPLRIEYAKTGGESERYLSFFDFEADDVRHVEFGEDVTFCRKWTSIGGQMWIEPDMTLRHHGSTFRAGNLALFLKDPQAKPPGPNPRE